VKVRILAVFVTVLAAVVVGALVFAGRSMLASRKAQAIERAPISAAVMRAPAHIVGIVSHSEPTFVRTCGCHPNVGVVYVNVGDMVKPVAVHQLLLNGATPLLELLPYRVPLSEIIAGKHDDWFRAYAQMVKRQQAEVLMSFEPEADGNWYDWAWTHVPPAEEIAAWRHVVTLFRATGAINVRWVWIVDKVFHGSGPLNRLWPGLAYVDDVGIDGYFRQANDTFASLFGPVITRIHKFSNRPIFISETGSNDVAGKVKALQALTAGVAQYHLTGFIWFDIDKPGLNNNEPQNFAISSNKAALDEYKSGLLPYMRPLAASARH